MFELYDHGAGDVVSRHRKLQCAINSLNSLLRDYGGTIVNTQTIVGGLRYETRLYESDGQLHTIYFSITKK